MDLNFLQQLLGSGSANVAPPAPAPQPTGNLSPEWFAGAMAQPEATAPVPQQPMPSQDLMAGRQVDAPAPDTNALQALNKPPRERRSILDTIGRISDVLAKVGGADALYQPTLDARQDRGFGIEDRTRKINMDNLSIQKAGQEVEAEPRARMANALAAVADAPNAAEIWPSIAAQAGIPAQQAAAIGQELARNPQAAGRLAKALGYTPVSQGSLPASIQNYALYQKIKAEQGEAAAEQFMRFAQPDMAAMRPYQEAQLAQGERRLTLDEQKSAEEASRAERELRLKEEKAAGGGGSDLTPTQRGVVAEKVQLLPVIKRQLKRVAELDAEMRTQGTLGRGAIGGLLPGALVGGTGEQFDKAVGALRKSILKMTRTPGVGSMSNYETALDEMSLPSRWGSDAGRTEALQGISELLNGLESGYGELLPRKAPTSPSRSAPRAGGTAGRTPAPAARPRKQNPQTGEIVEYDGTAWVKVK